jgi:cell fate regulator YaaT (PSP1 superfamily)
MCFQEEEGASVNDQAENQPSGPRILEYLEIAFRARRLAVYGNSTRIPLDIGSRVVVSVERGEDLGKVVMKYLPGLPLPSEPAGEFLRIASPEDLERAADNAAFEKKVAEYCKERIRTRKLDMKLTGCESQLDRKRLRIYFTADQRTDFRALVRDLAAEFRTRIEMRQIGVRDDARHRDGVGVCGQRLCCAAFLREFSSVTLKSVREQNMAPNPSKVSGACSRLMCCLAYESEFYRRAARVFPEIASRHSLGDRNAAVLSCDIFHDTVTVSWEEGSEETLDIAEFHRRRQKQGKRRTGEPGSQGETGSGEPIVLEEPKEDWPPERSN